MTERQSDPIDVREVKHEITEGWRERRRASRSSNRRSRRARRRCFWTPPRGHLWETDGTMDNSFDKHFICKTGCGATSKVDGF